MKNFAWLLLVFVVLNTTNTFARQTYNFNPGWKLFGKTISLPHAWNEDEAYARPIAELSNSIVTYTKKFRLPKMDKGSRVFLEFEGARMAAEVFVNNHSVVLSEDGITAFGCDITNYLIAGDNILKVVTDNDWAYRERATDSRFQWNDKNFNVNYGGLQKNVRLHIMPAVYQTLPLINTLGTTGQYIYATDYDIQGKSADIHAETEVINTTKKAVTRQMTVTIVTPEGKEIATFKSCKVKIPAHGKAIITAHEKVGGLHFWSWGYGYLYKVHTTIEGDDVVTTTGFRKAEFKKGMVYLNDRVIHIHGYAQRSSNEWPGVGMSVPPWLSDYGNDLCVKGGGNLVRWMHICPWKQEIESCDRVGLIQAMPAGDAEADVADIRWEQRKKVMRASIVYNRNNPSIIFYECGNKGISREHMIEMKAIRDSFDINGMRAIGSREMLDVAEAEYGGEMMYVNKSTTKPMWMMEYCRDEGLCKYWNSWTPTNLNRDNTDTLLYHEEGYGPLYRNAPAHSYNHNGDEFAVELVRRWYDYWLERPGTCDFVNAGGAKIIFSDTHTHCRSEMNYRLSGVTNPMRIPKDAYFVHKVMWDGWVDDLNPRTYIIGHWNYDEATLGKAKVDTIPVVYVVTNENCEPALSINGKEVNIIPEHESRFLYIYRNVPYEAGEIKATALHSSYSIHTAGQPAAIKLTPITNPTGWKADGADAALVEVEIVDAQGHRCPVDNRMISFNLQGAAEWRGGIAQVKQWDKNVSVDKYDSDNMALATTLPVENGVNRIMLRSLSTAGKTTLTASAKNLPSATITLETNPFDVTDGLAKALPNEGLTGRLDRGETPSTPSFVKSGEDVAIGSVEAGSNNNNAHFASDQNERTTWESSETEGEQWITFNLAEAKPVSEIVLKMGDWRSKSYPIEVIANGKTCYRGVTKRSLSYVHLPIGSIMAKQFTIRLAGTTHEGDAFATVKELDAKNDERKALSNRKLRIVEAQFIHKL